MHITVYSLKRTLFEGDAHEVNCMTASGEITVLDRHRPLVSLLRPGTMKIVDAGKQEHFFPVTGGFLEVKADNQARFIVEE